MTNSVHFLPISAELYERMRAVSMEVAREHVQVLFDGSERRPWGRYLTTEREDQYRERQKPLRSWRALSDDELAAVLYDAREASVEAAAIRHRVNPHDVQFLLDAVTLGVMVRR
jgi:hypothetical protein